MPDFLCSEQIAANSVKFAREGSPQVENTLYFGKRKNTAYPQEIKHLEEILAQNWSLHRERLSATT